MYSLYIFFNGAVKLSCCHVIIEKKNMRRGIMKSKKIASLFVAFAMAAAYIPVTGSAAFADIASDPTAQELEQAIIDAQDHITDCEEALAAAQSDLSTAQANYNDIGRAFINQKAGPVVTVEALTEIYKGNSEIRKYVTTTKYTKALNSALTVKNLNAAADFVTECNQLRANHGAGALKMNYKLMALSATSMAVSSQSDDHTVVNELYEGLLDPIEEDFRYYPSENLCWWADDPFDLWYTEEKSVFNKAVKSGKYPGLEDMDSNEIYETYPALYQDVGHYLNLIDGEAKITGYARVTSPEVMDEQCFDDEDWENGMDVTPEQFKSELASFAADAKDAVTEAQGAVTKAEQDLANARTALQQAQAEYDAYIDSLRISLETAEITGLVDKTYTGKALTQDEITVTVDGNVLEPTDFTVSYKNNVKVGTAKVTVTGKGDYKNSASATFRINPKGTKITRLIKGKKKMKVKWSKRTTQTTGYKIQYSLDSEFATDVKSKTVTKAKTTYKTIKKLKSKNTYYVRICTYKTVSGVKYYSDWSEVKSVTIK